MCNTKKKYIELVFGQYNLLCVRLPFTCNTQVHIHLLHVWFFFFLWNTIFLWFRSVHFGHSTNEVVMTFVKALKSWLSPRSPSRFCCAVYLHCTLKHWHTCVERVSREIWCMLRVPFLIIASTIVYNTHTAMRVFVLVEHNIHVKQSLRARKK